MRCTWDVGTVWEEKGRHGEHDACEREFRVFHHGRRLRFDAKMTSRIEPILMNLPLALVFVCMVLLLPHSLRADVRLPAIFSEHMVLMKAEAVPVWGKADAGEHVRVTINGKTVEANTDANGRWQASLNLKDSAPGPFEMTVEGKNRIAISDVVVGEVWLASGQSNMELPLRVTADADAEIAKSANPMLRQFAVKKTGANKPMEDCDGQWTVAGPATSGEFTAIGYYFGKELQQSLHRPAGIVHASNGGTYIEPWTPADALDQIEAFRVPAAALPKTAADYPIEKAKFVKDFAAWLKAHDREDKPCPDLHDYAAPNTATDNWSRVTLPSKTPVEGFPPSGVFWLRRDIAVSAIVAHQGFKIMIGPLGGYWQVYWNGKLLTETTYSQLPGKDFACYFAVPPEQILTGKNTLAICGDDHRWCWADAKIDGDSVLVWSDKVTKPVAVRYGWVDNPTCNLSNGAGLPASPFRTDDYPTTTAKVKVKFGQ